MKLFTSIVLASTLMSSVAMAEIKPGCIGGCMGTAIAAPTPSFPAGYQCKTNWPLGVQEVSCLNGSSRVFGYDTVTTETIHHPPSAEHPNGFTTHSTGRWH